MTPEMLAMVVDMLVMLNRLERVASNRENHSGDPSSLMVAKAELREAAEAARVLYKRVRADFFKPMPDTAILQEANTDAVAALKALVNEWGGTIAVTEIDPRAIAAREAIAKAASTISDRPLTKVEQFLRSLTSSTDEAKQ